MLPLHSQKNGAVAQLVEQRTENPCVGGSIPSHTTTLSYKALIINRLQRFIFVWGIYWGTVDRLTLINCA